VNVFAVGVSHDVVADVFGRHVSAETPMVKKLVQVVERKLFVSQVCYAMARYVRFG
jgi:hypothetical protein